MFNVHHQIIITKDPQKLEIEINEENYLPKHAYLKSYHQILKIKPFSPFRYKERIDKLSEPNLKKRKKKLNPKTRKGHSVFPNIHTQRKR